MKTSTQDFIWNAGTILMISLMLAVLSFSVYVECTKSTISTISETPCIECGHIK